MCAVTCVTTKKRLVRACEERSIFCYVIRLECQRGAVNAWHVTRRTGAHFSKGHTNVYYRALATTRLLTVQEAADMLGVTTGSLYQKIFRRQIPHVKLGHTVRFNEAALLEWIESHAVPEQ